MTFYERLQAETAAARGELLSIPIIQDALRGRIDLKQYLAFLSQAYHHVRHTAPLLMGCGSHLPARLSWMHPAVAHYIQDEIGHDEWILADIAACGADAEAVRNGSPALATDLMVAYAYHQIERKNPVGFFGMVFILEGTSVAVASAVAEAIRASLHLPANAFTYLSSHGNVDREHVQFFADLVNRLDRREDHDAIIQYAHAFCRLYGDMFRALPSQIGRTE